MRTVKELLADARKAIEDGDLEKAEQLKNKAQMLKDVEGIDEPETDSGITQEEDGSLSGEVKTLSEQVQHIMDLFDKAGPLKDAGYIAPDSETDHAESKSFGDWCMAVRNGNTKRLNTIYAETKADRKAMAEGSGTAGGYLVPEEFSNMLLEIQTQMSPIRAAATVVPVSTSAGKIPSLDQVTAPTAGVGQTAFAGGVVAAWAAEAATLNSTDAAFKQLEWEAHKVGGYTLASNELRDDSAISLDALLAAMFGRAIAGMEDYAFIRGTGTGMPLGVLNAPCTIAVTTTTNNQFKIEDGMKMIAQHQPHMGRTFWLLHRGLIPDLDAYWTVTQGTDFVQPREGVVEANRLAFNLLGYPAYFNEHMPNPDTDDAILGDWSAYVIFDRSDLRIAFSEHSAFTTDQATWRFTKRLDGKPWLNSTITLGSPVAYTTSPFLYHND